MAAGGDSGWRRTPARRMERLPPALRAALAVVLLAAGVGAQPALVTAAPVPRECLATFGREFATRMQAAYPGAERSALALGDQIGDPERFLLLADALALSASWEMSRIGEAMRFGAAEAALDPQCANFRAELATLADYYASRFAALADSRKP
jgi:hypothetical protein